jgi:hypothetical protein
VLLDAGHTDAQDLPDWEDLSLDERIAEHEAHEVSFHDWDALFTVARERATAWRLALEERIRAGMRERDDVIVARAEPRAIAAALHWLAAEPPSSTFHVLAGIDVPILLVLGSRNDTAEATARFRATVPHARIETLDSEHDLLAHAAKETVGLVVDWILGASA